MFYRMITNARNRWLASDSCAVKDLVSYIENTGQMRDAQIDAIKIYVHLDYHIGYYVKIPLDEFFCEDNFRKEFWDRTIRSNKRPLRLKIRNICGDETEWEVTTE